MTNVSEWSVTAGSNNSSPPDGWPEGMARSAVNDCAREMMAALAKWYKDMSGSLVTATSTTAYTLATNSVYTALSDISLLVFRAHAANTGTTTLNVDGLGAKPWRRDGSLADYATGEIGLGQLLVVGYDSVADDFVTVGPVRNSAFVTGTSMVFYQSTLPSGWVAVAQNDKALRVVTSGTTGGTAGGTTAFSAVMTNRTIGQVNLPSYTLSHSLTLPDHIHGHSFTLPDHTHGDGSLAVSTAISNGSDVARSFSESKVNVDQPGGQSVVSDTNWTESDLTLNSGDVSGVTGSPTTSPSITGAIGSPTTGPSINGSVTSGGSGNALNFAVQYVDVVIGTKN